MKIIENKRDLLLLFKTYFLFIFFILSLFSLSVYVSSKLFLENEITVENNNSDIFTQFLQKEKITSNVSENDSSYVIYANTDPVIRKIELFLANNKNRLTEEELAKVEKFRSERITYLMAKKYRAVIQDGS